MRRVILLLAFLLTLTSCSPNTGAGVTALDLMAGVTKKDIAPIVLDYPWEKASQMTAGISDFSLGMLRNICEGENVLISPLSLISALSMTANGAEKETLSQMEEVFGADIGSLNEYLYAYRFNLPNAAKYRVSLANSIWFRDAEDLTVEMGFLQTNKDYYDADVYKAPFDESTKDEINAWVKGKTHGQIQKLLDENPPEDAVMYLINALSFDAQWQNIYEDTAVKKGEFTTLKGDKRTVDFMRSTEKGYIELPGAVGFSKPYADDKYQFLALLPDEGLEVSDLVNSIDGKTLMDVFKNQRNAQVHAFVPKFNFEYGKELSEVLEGLGMKNAFDGKLADFSSLGRSTDGNIFISRVIHKTKIKVDEKGTEAGAVTGVEMVVESAAPAEPKTVELNRPFLFMIMDSELGLPIFMGVLNDVGL